MSLDGVVRAARVRGGLSLRELAARAGTSHATLSSYEHGRVSPGVDTLQRVVTATGHRLDARLEPLVADPHERGHELLAVLDLAGQFPAQHERRPSMPVFGRRRAASASAAVA